MENKKAIIIAIICGTISIVLVKAYLVAREKELTKDFGELVDVVVADGDFFDEKNTFIPEYGLIQSNMVKVIKVFKNYREPMTVTNPEEVIGKATYVPISRGEQITLTKLIHQDGRPVLDRQVEKKMRAVTILISVESGVSRLIRPGNHVDVLISPVYDQSNNTVVEIKTLIQNAVVLATGKHIMNEVPTRVDRELVNYIEEANAKIKRKDLLGGSTENLHTSRPDDNYNFVTLQLTAEDAQKVVYLTHAYGDKVIYLSLRNSNDAVIEKISSTILDDVLGPDSDYGNSKVKLPPPQPPPPPRYYDYIGDQKIPR